MLAKCATRSWTKGKQEWDALTGLASASKADTSEFGVPTTTLPSKYSWLGAIELPTELPSGVISMGARSYIPQLGRFLQPDPIPGGSANAYSYTFGDPVNSSDPSGEYTFVAGYVNEFDQEWAEGAEGREAVRVAERRAAEEAAARAAAEYAAQQAAWAAEAAAGPQYWEEWEEWWEEEGCEYASDQSGSYVRRQLAAEAGVALDTQEDLVEALQDLFRTFFPGKSFEGPVPTPDGRVEFPVSLPDGSTHDLDDLSSGEKEVLYGYMRLRSSAPKHSVVLVDEPELHLNHGSCGGSLASTLTTL
jgi:RHS repeat-associated protein